MSKTPTKHHENAPQKIDIIEQWNKKTPKLSEIKNYIDKVSYGKVEHIQSSSEKYKELVRIQNFLLKNKEISLKEPGFSMDKLHLLVYIMNEQKLTKEIFISNIIENPRIPENEKRNLLEAYAEGRENIFGKYGNLY